MSKPNLPELPSPLKEIAWLGGRPQDVYGRGEMIAYAEEAVRQALAAQRNEVIEDVACMICRRFDLNIPADLGPKLLDAIRSMSTPPEKDHGEST